KNLMNEAARLDIRKPAAAPNRGNHDVHTVLVNPFRKRDEWYDDNNGRGVSTGLDVSRDISDASRKYQTNPPLTSEQCFLNFLERLGLRPWKQQVNGGSRMFKTREVT